MGFIGFGFRLQIIFELLRKYKEVLVLVCAEHFMGDCIDRMWLLHSWKATAARP